jgi:O-antigen/teichoic acid export membrane protein
MGDADRAGSFAGRVLALFSTSVFGAGIGIVNGILLARFLGPSGKGDYYLLSILPATAMVFLQLGLPQAFTYFAARGQTAGLLVKSLVLTAALTGVALVGGAVFLPLVYESVLHDIDPRLALVAFVAFPLAMNATLSTGIVLGRRDIRSYAIVKSVTPLVTTVLLIFVLGVANASVPGAIVAYLIASAFHAFALFAGAARKDNSRLPGSPSYGDVFRYGLPFYPGSLATFFSYRIDVYLIAFLLLDPSVPLGYYSLAVGLAELVFFFPNAVSQLFFPQVAGAPREQSDQQVAVVARVTLLLTGAVAIALVPGAAIMIALLLPAFGPSMEPLIALLPGVVALSVAKVIGGYVAGIGRPGVNSAVSIASFIVNIAANLVLIPAYGIVGAAVASLLSYSISALLMTAIAARLTGAGLLSFWIPRLDDVRFVFTTSLGLLARVRGRFLQATAGR